LRQDIPRFSCKTLLPGGNVACHLLVGFRGVSWLSTPSLRKVFAPPLSKTGFTGLLHEPGEPIFISFSMTVPAGRLGLLGFILEAPDNVSASMTPNQYQLRRRVGIPLFVVEPHLSARSSRITAGLYLHHHWAGCNCAGRELAQRPMNVVAHPEVSFSVPSNGDPFLQLPGSFPTFRTTMRILLHLLPRRIISAASGSTFNSQTSHFPL